jgi:hypothetical protein
MKFKTSREAKSKAVNSEIRNLTFSMHPPHLALKLSDILVKKYPNRWSLKPFLA